MIGFIVWIATVTNRDNVICECADDIAPFGPALTAEWLISSVSLACLAPALRAVELALCFCLVLTVSSRLLLLTCREDNDRHYAIKKAAVKNTRPRLCRLTRLVIPIVDSTKQIRANNKRIERTDADSIIASAPPTISSAWNNSFLYIISQRLWRCLDVLFFTN